MTVTFLGITHSQALEDEIRERARKLSTACPDIISCHVAVSQPHRHHTKGNAFSLRVAVTTPGDEISVAREGMRDDLRAMVRDAFEVVRRRLDKHDTRPRHAEGPSMRG
jgi:ribosome-associated translation inhibitor RaiA